MPSTMLGYDYDYYYYFHSGEWIINFFFKEKGMTMISLK